MNVYIGPCILAKGLNYKKIVNLRKYSCQSAGCPSCNFSVAPSSKFCSSCGSAISLQVIEREVTQNVAEYWMHHDSSQGFKESLTASGSFGDSGNNPSTCLIPNKTVKKLNNKWVSSAEEVVEFKGDFNIQKEIDTFKEIYAKEIDYIEKLCGKKVTVAWRVVFGFG